MSKYLTDAAVTEFDNEVKHQYQGMGKLRNTVTVRNGVVGSTYKFARMGRGMANQKATQADVTPMDVTHTRPTATLENWNAPEYTDIFDQATSNYDEKMELAQTIAKALTRREDQLIIDAMAAVTYAATNDGNPDTGRIFDVSATANFTMDALRSARGHFQDIEVEGGEQHIALKAAALQELLSDTTVTSSDYNVVKALVNGELNTYMGFTFHVIGTRTEGGLPGVTGDEIAFAWDKAAIGIAIGIDMKTTIDWVAQKTSWLANGMLKAGVAIREAQGIVKIQYDETA